MKKLVREFQLSPAELETVRACATALHLTETVARILYARGMTTEAKMRAFLDPSARHFLSPFLMKGMKEAVALLSQAREEGWRVALFGDYDADGIGALAVLSRALKTFGIEPYLYVPERSEGYGMSRLVAERCDVLLSIPMKGKINSLNAASAAAVMLYEAVRQRL